MNNNKKRLIILLMIPVILLTIPFIAMQFSKKVDWTTFDFLVAGFLLFGVTLSIELIFRMISSKRNRLILLCTGLIIFLLIWIELAVGVFGTPLAGN